MMSTSPPVEEWIQVEHKKKQNQKQDHQHHPDRPQFTSSKNQTRVKNKWFTSQTGDDSVIKEPCVKTQAATASSISSSTIDIQSLIGKPVIQYDAPIEAKHRSKPDNERKGGLLYINPSSIDNFSYKKPEMFDSEKEVWPMLHTMNLDENSVTEGSGMAWSNVVRAPPKPRIVHVVIPKVATADSNVDDKDDMQLTGNDEEKTKKKKKKRIKDKPSEAPTLDLGAMLEALKSSKSPKKKSHISASKDNPISKVQKSDTGARNVLDSSAPLTRRGKEREAPKKKKLTPLRKTIIRERQERKKITEEGIPIPSILDVLNPSPVINTLPHGLHNRKFRDYCTHLVTLELNNIIESLVSDLVRFQDRVYKNEPLKLKTKRRYVCGLREVTKNLELKRLKCVIIPPNLDKIQSPGGINQSVEKIINGCNEQGVPVVYGLSRRQLAFVLKKKHHIGCLGIISFAGAEDKFKKITELVSAATKEYNRKKNSLINLSTNKPSDRPLAMTIRPIPSEDTTVFEMVEEAIESLTEEELESDDCEDDEEDQSTDHVPVSEWTQLFPTSSYKEASQLPPEASPEDSKTFSWNVSAPPFVPNFD